MKVTPRRIKFWSYVVALRNTHLIALIAYYKWRNMRCDLEINMLQALKKNPNLKW